MPPAKFQMSEKLRAEIKAKGDFFDISKYFVDKCYEINGIEETHQAYAERLRQAREEKSYLQKGYSQKDLAKAIGCSVECISRIERKKNKDIDVERLQVLAYILNVTPHYLLVQWIRRIILHFLMKNGIKYVNCRKRLISTLKKT